MTDEINPTAQDNTVALKSYIQTQLSSGFQPNEIAAQLRGAGWPEENIQQAFRLMQAQIMPSPVPAVAAPVTASLSSPTQSPMSEMPKRGRTKSGWLLFKQSLRVIKTNKGLTRYIIVSAILGLVLTIIFAVIIWLGHNIFLTNSTSNDSNNVGLKPLGYLAIFIYYVLAYFITNLYSAGLAANVLDLFQGNSKPYKEYMRRAWSKGLTLFIFSVMEATIGLILRVIVERSKLLGRLVAWILGALWSIARLFVIPIIVSSDVSAPGAIKQSTILLKNTWGENIVSRASFGLGVFLIYLLILIPVTIGLLILGAVLGGFLGAMIGLLLVIIIFIGFSIIVSAASSVLNTALFYYAQYKQIPAAFDADLINNAFVNRKKSRGLLSRKAN
jgi:hypothetical protein